MSRVALIAVGAWFAAKYQQLAIQNGTYRAARRMRKDGVPFEVAHRILTSR